jgi:hypothetical protein
MTNDPLSDPEIMRLVQGNLAKSESRRLPLHPLVERLCQVNGDLEEGIVEEQTAERDSGGHILRTRTRKQSPEMLVAKGAGLVDQIAEAMPSMSFDEFVAAKIALVTFLEAARPHVPPSQRKQFDRLGKLVTKQLAGHGIEVRPPYRFLNAEGA